MADSRLVVIDSEVHGSQEAVHRFETEEGIWMDVRRSLPNDRPSLISEDQVAQIWILSVFDRY